MFIDYGNLFIILPGGRILNIVRIFLRCFWIWNCWYLFRFIYVDGFSGVWSMGISFDNSYENWVSSSLLKF